MRFSTTIPRMSLYRSSPALLFACLVAGVFAPGASAQQSPPAASGARILLLPRRIVSGERATLAVLDVNGRLTPGVTVNFSNGDRLTTDATGGASRHRHSLTQRGGVGFHRSFLRLTSGIVDRPVRNFWEEFLRRCRCQSSDGRGAAGVRARVFANGTGRTFSVGPATRQRGGGSLLRETPVAAV